MAITSKMYASSVLNMAGGSTAANGPMDLLSDTLKLTLHTSTYTPSQTADTTKTNATNELSTANGYTALGATLASKTYSTSSLVTTFDAADVTWAGTSITFRHAVLWDDTPTSPADPLILYVDGGADTTTASADLTIQWNASGIFTITVS